MQALLETDHKKLVECMHDGLWGSGIPLYQPNCLNQQLWKRQGILGELLQDIRAKHLEITRSLLPANPWFQRGPPNLGLGLTDQPVSTPGHCSNANAPNASATTTLSPVANTEVPHAPNGSVEPVPATNTGFQVLQQ